MKNHDCRGFDSSRGPCLWFGKFVGCWLLASCLPLPAQDIVEGGSPLYQIAVHEALEGLRGRDKGGPAAAATPVPCAKCGQVHAAAGGTNTVAVTPPAAPHPANPSGDLCPVCGKRHAMTPSASPQRGVGLAAGVPAGQVEPRDDLYYCERCKTHHLRKAAVPQ